MICNYILYILYIYIYNISKIQKPGLFVLFLVVSRKNHPPGWSLPALNLRIPTGREWYKLHETLPETNIAPENV